MLKTHCRLLSLECFTHNTQTSVQRLRDSLTSPERIRDGKNQGKQLEAQHAFIVLAFTLKVLRVISLAVCPAKHSCGCSGEWRAQTKAWVHAQVPPEGCSLHFPNLPPWWKARPYQASHPFHNQVRDRNFLPSEKLG